MMMKVMIIILIFILILHFIHTTTTTTTGKLREIAYEMATMGTRTVVFDSELTPVQQRNLETSLSAEIGMYGCDNSGRRLVLSSNSIIY